MNQVDKIKMKKQTPKAKRLTEAKRKHLKTVKRRQLSEIKKSLRKYLTETHLGHFGILEDGTKVPLDFPMLDEQGGDTSWDDGEGNKVTLQDILDMTKNIPQKEYPTEKLAKVVLNWDDNPEEIDRISQVEISKQYPILIMVDEGGKIQWILDGNHRAQKALRSKSKTIPAKLIKPSNLDAKAKKVLLGVVQESLNEGGAAGHMAHPFDLPNVTTGKDLIKSFEVAADSLKKSRLTERFQQLAGIKPLYEIEEGERSQFNYDATFVTGAGNYYIINYNGVDYTVDGDWESYEDHGYVEDVSCEAFVVNPKNKFEELLKFNMYGSRSKDGSMDSHPNEITDVELAYHPGEDYDEYEPDPEPEPEGDIPGFEGTRDALNNL